MKKVKAEIDMQVGHSYTVIYPENYFLPVQVAFSLSYKLVFMMVEVTPLYPLPIKWTIRIYETKYSRMDQVKFVENSL